MRLIDADALSETLETLQRNADKYIPVERGIWMGFAYALTEIKVSPTVDAVRVVRCKDCKHRTELCGVGWHPCTDMAVNNNWYCADGERREE